MKKRNDLLFIPVLLFLAVLVVATKKFGFESLSTDTHGPRGDAGVAAVDESDAIPAEDVATRSASRASSSTELHRIHVVTEGGASVSGATMWLRCGSQLTRVGRTDADGNVGLSTVPNSETALIVKHPEFRTRELPLQSPIPLLVEVVLTPGASISGWVEFSDGSKVGSGVRVLACPEGSLDGNQALRALAEDPAVACSWTEDDGSFELSGLAPETEFRVVAAGKGLIPRGAQGDIRGFVRLTPSNSKVHLIVYPAYGGELVVLDRDTRLPIRVSKSIFFTPQQIIQGDLEARQAMTGTAEAILAGLDVPDGDLGFGHLPFLFVTDTPKGMVGPITYKNTVPGYEPIAATFFLEPLTGSPSRITVEVSRLVSGFGSLELELVGIEAAPPEESPVGAMQGLLKLSSDSGPSITLSMPVGQQHSFVADDIPYGAYRVTYHSFSASLTLPAPDDPPILVEISDVPAHALIDFSRSGALRFELYAADGTTYEGPVQVEIRAEGKPSIAPIVNLSSCPCRLVAVEPGEYSIRFGAPFFVDYEASRREVQRVEVVAGQPTTVIAFSPR